MRLLTKGGEHQVADDLIDAYRKAYPMVDVDRQFALMRIWLESNPSRRPKKNLARFITSWLNRAPEKLTLGRTMTAKQRSATVVELRGANCIEGGENVRTIASLLG